MKALTGNVAGGSRTSTNRPGIVATAACCSRRRELPSLFALWVSARADRGHGVTSLLPVRTFS